MGESGKRCNFTNKLKWIYEDYWKLTYCRVLDIWFQDKTRGKRAGELGQERKCFCEWKRWFAFLWRFGWRHCSGTWRPKENSQGYQPDYQGPHGPSTGVHAKSNRRKWRQSGSGSEDFCRKSDPILLRLETEKIGLYTSWRWERSSPLSSVIQPCSKVKQSQLGFVRNFWTA